MMTLLAQTANAAQSLESLNPIGVIEDASRTVPGFEGGLSSALNILILLTVLTVAPAILILCTSFTRMVVVLGLLRQALGTQTLPPS
ncbi:MAG: flagellar biosynthetic protein FliP, partial [Planctomycetota bacterium]